jgi:nucleotide-binding universal stress UspA family protein
MISRVLIAMDDPEMVERAIEYAVEAYPTAEVTVLHVIGEPTPMMGEAARIAIEGETLQMIEHHDDNVHTRAEKIADEYGITITTEIRVGNPSREIITCARDFDAIVIGSHKSKLVSRLLRGNVANTVVRHSSVPVTVLH